MSNYPKPANGSTVADAAITLEIGKRDLLARLRQLGIFTAENIPMRDQIQAGNFCTQNGGFTLPGYNIERHTQRAIVTPRGMRFLEKLINQDEKLQQAATRYRRRNRGAAHADRTPQGLKRRARRMASAD